MQPLAQEVKHLGLPATAAMHHAMHLCPVLRQNLRNHRGIRPSGRKEELAGRYRWHATAYFYRILQVQLAGVDQLRLEAGVVGLWELLVEALPEHVMAGGCEPVASHAAVVLALVRGLPCGGQANHDVAGRNPSVVYDITPLAPRGDGGVHDDCPHEVSDVSRLPACGDDVHAVGLEFREELLGAPDDRSNDLAWYRMLVAADGAR
mmetsp:Transcript_81990/g.211280  ORF Transcript_81990/g.211280 Transcript_81990/m.211280 type:complete len:206 (+) Transcript_81990:597-1214(+)